MAEYVIKTTGNFWTDIQIDNIKAEDNWFEKFALMYYNFLSECIDKFSTKKTVSKLFSGTLGEKLCIDEDILDYIKYNYELVQMQINSYEEFQKVVKNFTEFLLTANKLFMYPNLELNPFYIFYGNKATKDNMSLEVSPTGLDIHYLFTFRDTKIDIPDDNEDYNFLHNYINGDDKLSKHVELMDIRVDRKSIGGELTEMQITNLVSMNSLIKDNKDRALISIIYNTVTNMISDCFIDILDNYVAKCALHDNIKIGEVIKNDIWLWRPIAD